MRYCYLTPLVVGLLLAADAGITFCLAGDAVFSSNGKIVYSIAAENDKSLVQEIDLETRTVRSVVTPDLSGITCASDNTLFCVSRKSLFSFEPKSGALTKIRDAEPGMEFWRIAYNPKDDRVLVTTDKEDQPLFAFQKPGEWIPVRMRRHPYPSCLVFAKSGELFFAAYGDLWHGEIQNDEGYYSLAAYRYAPLATLETQNTTPAEIGVEDIGVARDSIYVQLARMGGSGDGWFARLARPFPKRTEDGSLEISYEPESRLPIYQKSIASLKILGDDFRAGSIAVSPDERRVHYIMHDKHWLVTDGKTEELHLTQK